MTPATPDSESCLQRMMAALPLIATLASAVISGCVSILMLNAGVTIVFQNLFYIPIILACYFFHRRGLAFSLGLVIFYAGLILVYTPDPTTLLQAGVRVLIFIAVAALITFLAERLEERKREYEAVFRASHSGIALYRRDPPRFTDANARFFEICGRKRDEIATLTPHMIFPGDNPVPSLLKENRAAFGYEAFVRRPDGTVRNVILAVSPVRQGHLAITIEDVTEQVQAEQARAASEKRLNDLLSFLPDPTFAIDPQGRVIIWNRAMEELTGSGAQDVIGKGEYTHSLILYGTRRPMLIDLVLDPATDVPDGYRAVQRIDHMLVAESIVPMPDGTTRVRWGIATPFYNQEGEVVGAVESIRDITERDRMEVALRESEEKYRSLVENLDVGIVRITPADEGRFIWANTPLATMLGYLSPGEMRDISVRSITVNPATWDELVTQLRNAGGVRNHVVLLKKRNGSPIWASVTVSPRYDDSGTLQWIDGVIDDITDRKNMQDALSQANTKLHLLSTITRHDILNQLTVLLGFIEIAQEMTSDAALTRVLHNQEKALQTIERQILFTRDYQQVGVQSPQWQDVGAIIHGLLESISPGDVKLVNSADSYEIFADPLIEKVFYNLIENALRYGEKITAIIVSAEETVEGLDLFVEDNGIGIPEGEKEKIFQHGYGKNTGLGLFLAREILLITGITIREAGIPDAGAKFVIHVPSGSYRLAKASEQEEP